MEGKKMNIHEMPYAVLEIDQSRRILDRNKAAEGIGVVTGSFCWDSFGKLASLPEKDRAFFETHKKAPDGGTRCTHCKADEALAKQQHIVIEQKIGETLWEIHWIPTGKQTYIHYGIDITKGK